MNSQKFLGEQLEIQEWLKKAMVQNIGVFEIEGKGEVVYDMKSIGVFGHKNPIRIAIVKVTEHRMFDALIFAFILIDSISQAVYDYSDVNSVSMLNQNLEII